MFYSLESQWGIYPEINFRRVCFRFLTKLLSSSFFSLSYICFSISTHAVEANERAGAGEGFPAGGPGSGGAGPRMVPGPNPQCHRETAAHRPKLTLCGQFKHYCETATKCDMHLK